MYDFNGIQDSKNSSQCFRTVLPLSVMQSVPCTSFTRNLSVAVPTTVEQIRVSAPFVPPFVATQRAPLVQAPGYGQTLPLDLFATRTQKAQEREMEVQATPTAALPVATVSAFNNYGGVKTHLLCATENVALGGKDINERRFVAASVSGTMVRPVSNNAPVGLRFPNVLPPHVTSCTAITTGYSINCSNGNVGRTFVVASSASTIAKPVASLTVSDSRIRESTVRVLPSDAAVISVYSNCMMPLVPRRACSSVSSGIHERQSAASMNKGLMPGTATVGYLPTSSLVHRCGDTRNVAAPNSIVWSEERSGITAKRKAVNGHRRGPYRVPAKRKQFGSTSNELGAALLTAKGENQLVNSRDGDTWLNAYGVAGCNIMRGIRETNVSDVRKPRGRNTETASVSVDFYRNGNVSSLPSRPPSICTPMEQKSVTFHHHHHHFYRNVAETNVGSVSLSMSTNDTDSARGQSTVTSKAQNGVRCKSVTMDKRYPDTCDFESNTRLAVYPVSKSIDCRQRMPHSCVCERNITATTSYSGTKTVSLNSNSFTGHEALKRMTVSSDMNKLKQETAKKTDANGFDVGTNVGAKNAVRRIEEPNDGTNENGQKAGTSGVSSNVVTTKTQFPNKSADTVDGRNFGNTNLSPCLGCCDGSTIRSYIDGFSARIERRLTRLENRLEGIASLTKRFARNLRFPTDAAESVDLEACTRTKTSCSNQQAASPVASLSDFVRSFLPVKETASTAAVVTEATATVGSEKSSTTFVRDLVPLDCSMLAVSARDDYTPEATSTSSTFEASNTVISTSEAETRVSSTLSYATREGFTVLTRDTTCPYGKENEGNPVERKAETAKTESGTGSCPTVETPVSAPVHRGSGNKNDSERYVCMGEEADDELDHLYEDVESIEIQESRFLNTG